MTNELIISASSEVQGAVGKTITSIEKVTVNKERHAPDSKPTYTLERHTIITFTDGTSIVV